MDMENKIYRLEAEIDLTKEPSETRVKPIADDVWEDFGFWLEVTGFMAYQAMKYREWNKEQISEYVKDYFEKCFKDYKLNKGK
jgi:hypothetical protein